jgi:peroxiredoxin
MSETLSSQLADYRAGWRVRVPAERQAVMDAHVAALAASGIGSTAKQVGDHAPAIRLPDQHGAEFDVATLLAKGPVVVTFYRGGWCPFCNFELKAYQQALPRLAASGASLVAISPETPDHVADTATKNELSFPVLSDVGQAVARSFGIHYAFTAALRTVYDGFKLDIPGRNGTPDDWSLPLSATYLIGSDGTILFADTRTDYRERTDPEEVLGLLEHRAAAE